MFVFGGVVYDKRQIWGSKVSQEKMNNKKKKKKQKKTKKKKKQNKKKNNNKKEINKQAQRPGVDLPNSAGVQQNLFVYI